MYSLLPLYFGVQVSYIWIYTALLSKSFQIEILSEGYNKTATLSLN